MLTQRGEVPIHKLSLNYADIPHPYLIQTPQIGLLYTWFSRIWEGDHSVYKGSICVFQEYSDYDNELERRWHALFNIRFEYQEDAMLFKLSYPL